MSVRQVVSISVVFALLPVSALGQTPPPAAVPDQKSPPDKLIQVRGRVIDDDGKPVHRAKVEGIVYAITVNSSWAGKLEETRTNELGEFALPEWRGGNSTLAIRAWKDGAFTAKAVEVKGDAGDQTIELTISPKNARDIFVRVIDDQGSPI